MNIRVYPSPPNFFCQISFFFLPFSDSFIYNFPFLMRTIFRMAGNYAFRIFARYRIINSNVSIQPSRYRLLYIFFVLV